jgi:hypothetical protein
VCSFLIFFFFSKQTKHILWFFSLTKTKKQHVKKNRRTGRFFPILHRFTRFSPVHLRTGFAGLTGPKSLLVPGLTGQSGPVLTTLSQGPYVRKKRDVRITS